MRHLGRGSGAGEGGEGGGVGLDSLEASLSSTKREGGRREKREGRREKREGRERRKVQRVWSVCSHVASSLLTQVVKSHRLRTCLLCSSPARSEHMFRVAPPTHTAFTFSPRKYTRQPQTYLPAYLSPTLFHPHMSPYQNPTFPSVIPSAHQNYSPSPE